MLRRGRARRTKGRDRARPSSNTVWLRPQAALGNRITHKKPPRTACGQTSQVQAGRSPAHQHGSPGQPAAETAEENVVAGLDASLAMGLIQR